MESIIFLFQNEGIEDVQEMVKTNEERPDRRLRGVAAELENGCAAYNRLVKGTGGSAAGKTKLDRERHKLCLREMVRILLICIFSLKIGQDGYLKTNNYQLSSFLFLMKLQIPFFFNR